jgi:hypothetical protein
MKATESKKKPELEEEGGQRGEGEGGTFFMKSFSFKSSPSKP